MNVPTQFTRVSVLVLVAAVAIAGFPGSAAATGVDKCEVTDSVQVQGQELTQENGEVQVALGSDQNQAQDANQYEKQKQCGDNSIQAQNQSIDQNEFQVQVAVDSDQNQDQLAEQSQAQSQFANNSVQVQDQDIDQNQAQLQLAANSSQDQSQTASQNQEQQQGA